MRLDMRSMLCGVLMATVSSVAMAQDKSMIDEVKERGVLRAGVKNDAPHLGFTDDRGQYAGFEIDLVNDLARRLGVKVEYTPVKASNRVQLLQQKRIDIIFATVSHYRSRDQVVDFTVAYLYTPQTLLVRKDSGIKSVADLANKRVGADAAAGSVKKIPKMQPKATIQTFQGWPEAFFALERGTVDAVATDNIILAGLRAGSPDPGKYVLVGSDGIYSGGYYAVALRENDSKSRDTLNFLLQDQWVDGTWQKAFDKWLGKDSPLKMTLEDFDNFKIQVWDN
jgi:polar amino acid transport system substrate-binding protein